MRKGDLGESQAEAAEEEQERTGPLVFIASLLLTNIAEMSPFQFFV